LQLRQAIVEAFPAVRFAGQRAQSSQVKVDISSFMEIQSLAKPTSATGPIGRVAIQ